MVLGGTKMHLELREIGQLAFDPLKYADRREALRERRETAKKLQEQGYRTILWTLRNQQIGYSGLGTERDLRCRNVYMLDYIRE